MSIKVLKIVTGEDVVADVEETELGYLLTNPCIIQFVQKEDQVQVGLMPYPFLAHGESTHIAKAHVVLFCEAPAQLANNYRSRFGSGIVIPQVGLSK